MSAELDDDQIPPMLLDWLARARAGDEAALDKLLTTLSRILRRRARQHLATRTELRGAYGSDDFQQLALIDLAEQIRNGQVRAKSCGEFLQFVSTVVQQRILGTARRELADRRDLRRTVPLKAVPEPLSGDASDPEHLAMAKDVLAVVRRHLTPKEREICELYLQGTAWRGIAAQVGGTENSVRHKWRRALFRLRRQLTPPPPEGFPSTPKLMAVMRTDSASIRP